MKTGDIVLIPFPFAELTHKKVRPAVVIGQTKDRHKDLIVSAISSIVPKKTTVNEIIINPTNTNNLRTKSVIKIDRIVTLKREDMIAKLGELSEKELKTFKNKFKKLID